MTGKSPPTAGTEFPAYPEGLLDARPPARSRGGVPPMSRSRALPAEIAGAQKTSSRSCLPGEPAVAGRIGTTAQGLEDSAARPRLPKARGLTAAGCEIAFCKRGASPAFNFGFLTPVRTGEVPCIAPVPFSILSP